MKTKLILSSGITLVAFLFSSCEPGSQTFTPPANWPTINKSETEFRKYFDLNSGNLNPIEGIWTMNESGTWRNVYSGMTGSIPSRNSYRLAIVKDSSVSSYDFVAVVLESPFTYWMAGRIKAYFRKTAYDRVYEAVWYMGDYSSNRNNYTLDESGLIKSKSHFMILTISTSNPQLRISSSKRIRPSLENSIQFSR